MSLTGLSYLFCVGNHGILMWLCDGSILGFVCLLGGCLVSMHMFHSREILMWMCADLALLFGGRSPIKS